MPKRSSQANPWPWRKGDRVELHPATDRWMMGDRYGEVVGVIRAHTHEQDTYYRVRLDKSGKSVNVSAANILRSV